MPWIQSAVPQKWAREREKEEREREKERQEEEEGKEEEEEKENKDKIKEKKKQKNKGKRSVCFGSGLPLSVSRGVSTKLAHPEIALLLSFWLMLSISGSSDLWSRRP